MLDAARRTPQPARIHTIGIERAHLIVDFLRGLRTSRDPVEIANILSRLRNALGRIGGTRLFVSRDDSMRLQCVYRVKRREPLLP